ncbi:MAG TPA: hypothetical protein P5076_22315, partial [Myxococcota bacterium]|nr:hypothetical protein [Myxococcota bacterium]
MLRGQTWRAVAGAAFGLTLLAGCSEPAPLRDAGKAPGRVLTVDNSGDAGQYVAMDLDVEDGVHLVFYDKAKERLQYVRHAAKAGFAADTVDDACKSCVYGTIRVTSPAEPHILYYSDATQTLTYAYRKEGRWLREPVEWGKGTGMGARLMLDDQQQLHAIYYSGDGYLKHAWRVPNPDAGKPAPPPKPGAGPAPAPPEGLWGNERVDKANGSEKVQIGVVRQPNGRLAASYLHWSGMSSELRVAIQGADGTWSTEVAAHENNPGKSSALYFVQDGTPRVIFREALKDRLARGELTAEGWKGTTFVPDAYNMALAVDSNGRLVLAYMRMDGQDVRKGHLRMAMKAEQGWADYLVDETAGAGSYVAAGLTAAGQPVVAYYTETTKSLKL